MKDELYGTKLIQKYEPTAFIQPTDLVSAEFSLGHFRNTYAQMTQEERNNMRLRHWYRDPSIDTWVFCPDELNTSEISRNKDESTDIAASPTLSTPVEPNPA